MFRELHIDDEQRECLLRETDRERKGDRRDGSIS